MTTRLNLIVIRVADIERSARLFGTLGLHFKNEQHGKGPKHFSATIDGITLELYPLQSKQQATNHARLGFLVDRGGLESVIAAWTLQGGTRVLPPNSSPWGLRAVLRDFDGHTVELT